MSNLYLECNSGISGDMAIAALLDAGADEKVLQKALNSIPAKGFKTEITRVSKNGIDCCDFNVILDAEHENHDHDMEYLFGHENAKTATVEQSRNHQYEENNSDCHFDRLNDHDKHHHEHDEHHHEHVVSTGSTTTEHHHHHEHRNLNDVLEIIDKTEMTDGARKLAHKIFQIIAEAESKAHGLPIEKVHFHEVGAIDSIVDVIALSVCFDNLNPSKVFVPFMNEGIGTIRCQHGILPIPVPAVTNIVQKYSLPLHLISDKGEFITPTGAAFVAAVITDKVLPNQFTVKKIGLGAGKRTYSRPSILRAFIIIEETENAHHFELDSESTDKEMLNQVQHDTNGDEIVKLETNIDDCTGEALGFVMDELFSAGARDVNYIPCFMKKNRPAYLLSVICTESDREKLEKIIFKNTTTIGIRRSYWKRTCLSRKELELDSPYGKFRAKEVEGNGIKRALPEYDDVTDIARKSRKGFEEIYSELSEICAKVLKYHPTQSNVAES